MSLITLAIRQTGKYRKPASDYS